MFSKLRYAIGKIKYILRAFKKIYTLMEEKSYLMNKPESKSNINNKMTEESLFELNITVNHKVILIKFFVGMLCI